MPRYLVSTPAESLTATVAKSVLGIIAGATRRFRVLRIQMGASSVTASDAPVLFEICRTNQAGAGTSSAVTPEAVDPAEPASICTAARTYTVEPTVVTVRDNFRVSPIGNTYLWEVPPGREYVWAISTTFVLRVTAPQNQSNVTISVLFEE